jgi:hypothetical protein
MEVPDLSSSTVWNLDDHISVVNEIEVSLVWKCRNNVEISLNIETESLIKLTLSRLSFPFIYINNIPLLMDLVILLIDSNVSVFLIDSTLYFNNFTFVVND